jgi:hypothetical protein
MRPWISLYGALAKLNGSRPVLVRDLHAGCVSAGARIGADQYAVEVANSEVVCRWLAWARGYTVGPATLVSVLPNWPATRRCPVSVQAQCGSVPTRLWPGALRGQRGGISLRLCTVCHRRGHAAGCLEQAAARGRCGVLAIFEAAPPDAWIRPWWNVKMRAI